MIRWHGGLAVLLGSRSGLRHHSRRSPAGAGEAERRVYERKDSGGLLARAQSPGPGRRGGPDPELKRAEGFPRPATDKVDSGLREVVRSRSLREGGHQKEQEQGDD